MSKRLRAAFNRSNLVLGVRLPCDAQRLLHSAAPSKIEQLRSKITRQSGDPLRRVLFIVAFPAILYRPNELAC
jgi:hypothetical protein